MAFIVLGAGRPYARQRIGQHYSCPLVSDQVFPLEGPDAGEVGKTSGPVQNKSRTTKGT